MLAVVMIATLLLFGGAPSGESKGVEQDEKPKSTDWIRNESDLIRFKIEWLVIKDTQVRNNCGMLCHVLENEKDVSRVYASSGRKQLEVRIVMSDVGDLRVVAKESIATISSVLLESDLSTAVIEFHGVAEDDGYGPMLLSTKISFDKKPKKTAD